MLKESCRAAAEADHRESGSFINLSRWLGAENRKALAVANRLSSRPASPLASSSPLDSILLLLPPSRLLNYARCSRSRGNPRELASFVPAAATNMRSQSRGSLIVRDAIDSAGRSSGFVLGRAVLATVVSATESGAARSHHGRANSA